MRMVVLVCTVTAMLAGVARAQTRASQPATDVDHGYVEGVAQSAFGNVTSQSYGGEGGVTIRPRLQVFLEGGRIGDTTSSSIAAAAQQVASFLSATAGAATYTARVPVTFFNVGVRYSFQAQGQLRPYAMGGGGIAHVTRDVRFTVNGADITTNLPQYGVALGTDLSGTERSGMIVAGGGLVWTVWAPFIIDLQYRYGRVFADESITVNRAGIGIGVRF